MWLSFGEMSVALFGAFRNSGNEFGQDFSLGFPQLGDSAAYCLGGAGYGVRHLYCPVENEVAVESPLVCRFFP